MSYRPVEPPSTNPKIRSFLSPLSRVRRHSLSSSEKCSNGIEEHKTYIEFKRITRGNGEILNKQIQQKV